jgi:hypothetical protein
MGLKDASEYFLPVNFIKCNSAWSEEDEKIRKAIIKHFEKERKESRKVNYYGVDVFDILAWLKDQKCIDVLDEKEREFADDADAFRKECDAAYQRGYNEGVRVTLEKQEWGKKDKDVIDTIIWTLIDREVKEGHPDEYELEVNWLKSLKGRVQPQPKQEWSEEDEYYYTKLEHFLDVRSHYEGKSQYQEEVKETLNWLQSLRPQNTWKPSDEQMKALYEETQKSDRIRDERIVSLFEDLKKLREE